MAPPASPFRRLAVDPLLQLPQWNRNFALDQHVERSAPAPQPPQPAAPASQPALPAGLQPREQGVQLYAPGAKSVRPPPFWFRPTGAGTGLATATHCAAAVLGTNSVMDRPAYPTQGQKYNAAADARLCMQEEQGTPQMPRARRIVFGKHPRVRHRTFVHDTATPTLPALALSRNLPPLPHRLPSKRFHQKRHARSRSEPSALHAARPRLRRAPARRAQPQDPAQLPPRPERTVLATATAPQRRTAVSGVAATAA